MLRLSIAAVFAAVLAASPAFARADAGNTFAKLEFRNIGPTTGRIDAVAGVPGDSATYFAGGIGGLWRTTDGGTKWEAVFDKKTVTSIGAIAVAPSNPKILYIGTGEPNMRNDVAFGDGVWRSNDGGTTWTHLGLDATAAIVQISIDSKDPNIAYVAAVGDPFKPSPDRGLYKTVDGGKHWQKVLYVDDTTGASTIAISPKNPKIVFAGMWTVQRRPWMLTSGGPRDGVYRSNDAGAHWTRVQGNGFPSGLTGRIGLRFAPSSPNILYALMESKEGSFWTSKDGGSHWTLTSTKHEIIQRPYYFSQFTVDPKNAKHIFFMTIVEIPSESFDGGKTVKSVPTGAYDHHQMWIDPVNGKRAIIGADAGVRLSWDGGKSWRDPQLIVSQPYHISVDDRVPYTVCGEFQDPGAVCGPELSFTGAITPDQWFSAQSGESGWIVFSPADDNMIYGTGYQEAVLSFDRKAMQGRLISPWPDTYSGTGAQSYKYRGAWVAPVAVSPLEPNALYFGAQYLMKTEDGGVTWNAISPDLTRNDKTKQQPSGQPITRDNAGTEVYDTIASIAESPIVKGELWAGTDDGLVWVSRDGGAHWSNVTAGIPNLPQWARINNVDPSPYDDGTAYIVAENHKLGDRTPYLYVTRDFGAHWQSISGNLPRDSYARMLRQDPVRKGMLYAGTETGLWLSFDDGAHWQPFFNNLPHAPVYDFVVQKRFDDLVVALHGRGVWILDDIAPLQQWSANIANTPAYLFPVRDAYRFNASWGTWATGEGAGDNQEQLAVINFYLQKQPAKKAKLSVQVFDGTKLLRTIEVSHPVAGMNRVWWDLTCDTIKPISDYHANANGAPGPQVVPGNYAVRLSYDGTSSERTIKVLPDPKTPGTQADMQASFELAMQLRDDYRHLGNDIVALRSLSTSLQNTAPRVTSHADAARAVSALQSTVDSTLDTLYIRNAQNYEDTLRVSSRLYERILNAEAGLIGSDYAPTDGQRGLAKELHDAAHSQFAADDELLGAKLNAVNALLKSAGAAPIIVKRGNPCVMIDTIVIIVKENHGFDNYFGTFPGANGMTKGLARAPNPPTADPNHTHEGWLVRETTAARLQYLESDIPDYFQYARQYTLCDNYFTAVAGPSTPNHLMLITADSPVIDNPHTYRGKPQQTYDLPSVPAALSKAGLTWRAYCTGYPFNLIRKIGNRNRKPQAQFVKDAGAGKLANVSWIYGPQGLDEHPLANVTNGMKWTVTQVQAVMNGPQWKSCAIFITWDDWGGWYDHVTPPLIEKWTDGTQFYPGGRVGCLMISPFAKRGYISKAQHTHVSIVKFCETIFKLPALNKRDAASDGMEDCFDFGAAAAQIPKKKSTAKKKRR